MVAETAPPSARRALPRAVVALLQLLTAAAAAVALYWLSIRVLSDLLARANRYGPLPPSTDLMQAAVSALSLLPVVSLAALWLRDLGSASLPPARLPLLRAVLGAWGWIVAAILLAAIIGAAALMLLPAPDLSQLAATGYWTFDNPLFLHDLGLLLLWVAFLPRALARLSGLSWRRLRPQRPTRRIACLAILALPLAADLGGNVLLSDALLFLDPMQQPWRFLALHYAQALGVALAFALALLAVWRLLSRPGLRGTVPAA